MADSKLKIIVEAVTKGTQDLQKMANRLGSIGQQAALLSAPILAFAATSVAAWSEAENQAAQFQDALGVTEEKAKDLGDISLNLFADNMAGSITEAGAVVEAVFRAMGDASDEAIDRMARKAISLKDTFNVEVEESLSAAKTLMDQFGLSEQQAFDMIASGFQKGLNRSGDFLESIEEYSVQFKNAGLSADEFFSAMQTGAQGGMLGTDKISDLIKEFRVRIQDGSDATTAALSQIGINVNEMQGQLAAGTMSAGDAFKIVIDRLKGVEDKSVQMQAGVGLLGTQFEDLGQDAVFALDLAATKMSDMAGASDAMTAKYEAISSLGKKMWNGFLAGGVQAVDMLNNLIVIIQQTDTTTIALIGTFSGMAAAAVAWQAGGKIIAGACINIIVQMKAMIVSTRAATVALMQSNAVIMGLAWVAFAAVLVYTVVKVYEAVNAFNAMRDAQKEAAAGWQNYANDMQATLDKYDEFKTLPELPANLTSKSQAELAAYRDELQKTKVYYTALYLKNMEKAQERTFFGNLTDEAKAAQAEMAKAKEKIDSVNASMAKIDAAGFEKPAKAAIASKSAIESFEKAAKKAYDEALKAAQKYAEEAISWEEKIKYSRLSSEDKLREMARGRMDEAGQQADIELQAQEKASAAMAALKQKDYALAEKLNQQSMGLYEKLADKNYTVAEKGFKERAAFEEQLYKEQLETARKNQQAQEQTAQSLKENLDSIAQAREAKVSIKLENLKEMENELKELTKDEEKTITIKTVEKKAAGGPVGFARGGSLPGYGGGDRIRAILEAGEFVIRKEAVKKYGVGFFHFLNNLRNPFDMSAIAALKNIRIPAPALPRFAYAEGGPVSTGNMQDMGSIDINLAGNTYPVFGQADVIKALKNAYINENRRRPN